MAKLLRNPEDHPNMAIKKSTVEVDTLKNCTKSFNVYNDTKSKPDDRNYSNNNQFFQKNVHGNNNYNSYNRGFGYKFQTRH